jgi:RINT-1 / TIP-1 family
MTFVPAAAVCTCFCRPFAGSLCLAVSDVYGTHALQCTTKRIEARLVATSYSSFDRRIARAYTYSFQYHFCADRPTNRADKPEWMYLFLSKTLMSYLPTLRDRDTLQQVGKCVIRAARNCAANAASCMIMMHWHTGSCVTVDCKYRLWPHCTTQAWSAWTVRRTLPGGLC